MDTDPNLGGVFIPTSEVYRTLLEVKYDVRVVGTKLDDVTSTKADHESRIRGLEKYKYALGASVISSISALVLALIEKFNP